MSSVAEVPKKKVPLLKIGAVLLVLAVVAVLLLRGVPIGAWIDRAMAVIQKAGPVAFFAGMAILWTVVLN